MTTEEQIEEPTPIPVQVPVPIQGEGPQYLKDGRIRLNVFYEGEWVKFVANANDVSPTGRLLHAAAENGDFGPIAAYVAPPFNIGDYIAVRLEALASKRYDIETGGITLSGVQIATDRESQAMVSSTYASMAAGFITQTEWKGEDGWATLTIVELTPIAAAVAQHVDAAFSNERLHADALVALGESLAVELAAQTMTQEEVVATIAAYDIGTGWTT